MHSRLKKRDPRYLIRAKFEGSELRSFQAQKTAATFKGQVNNISDGGFCLLVPHAPRPSALLQGLLKLPDVPARIPTLVQVRWIERPSHGKSYRIGLQYVI